MTEGVLSSSQRTRRRRILEAALELAAEGGYDAVQMREVASAADVALGTLYRYFPSKDHLLVSAMLSSIEDLHERLASKPPRGESAAERVVDVLARATRGFTRQKELTSAMLRAVMGSNGSLAPLVTDVRSSMARVITEAMHQGEATRRESDAARVLEYMWMGSLVTWLNGVNSGTQVLEDLETAVRLLVPE